MLKKKKEAHVTNEMIPLQLDFKYQVSMFWATCTSSGGRGILEPFPTALVHQSAAGIKFKV